MWWQSANHSHSLRWELKTAPWEFQKKLLHYLFLSNNTNNLHFRSFTHESNTCVIRRLAFLNLDFTDLLSCIRFLPLSATSHHRILIFSRTPKSWDCSQDRSWGFPKNCAGGRHWVILVDPRRPRKINQSIEVWTSEVRVLTFELRSTLTPYVRLSELRLTNLFSVLLLEQPRLPNAER